MHRDSSQEQPQRLEELVARQGYVWAKLQRDGAYPCEIQAARRALRELQAKLEAARRRRH